MNSYMNISVRVSSAAAQKQIQLLEKEIATLRGEMASTARSSSAFPGAGGFRGIERWGSQMQWMGRQLIYNFTIPIAAAGVVATKFALDNEAAMVRVQKVYGDASHQWTQYRGEIDALGQAFVALSNKYGVAQSDVINIGADWAQAGASGLALAKATKLTLETMVLGEMDAKTTTQALISIQAQYGQSIGGLTKTVGILNMVENQTGVNMQGLIEGFTRAASVARASGVDVRHLAAFIAALSPATGSAATAGNALKTILSRLFAPTKSSTELLHQMGIEVGSTSWQMKNGTQRIETMAKAFQGLTDNNKALISSTIASRYQINRFDVLMQSVASNTGYYARALKSTSSNLAVYKQYQQELNQVLTSNPQQLKRVWVTLQNALAQIIVPMIPAIIYLAESLANLANKFANLNPGVQKLILLALGLLALVGPLVRYFGAFGVLIGNVGTALVWMGARLGFVAVEAEAAEGSFLLMHGGLLGLAKEILAFPFVVLIKGVGKLGGALASVVGFLRKFFWAAFVTVFASIPRIAAAAASILPLLFTGAFTLIEGAAKYFAAGLRLTWIAVETGAIGAVEGIRLAWMGLLQFFEMGVIPAFLSLRTGIVAIFSSLPEIVLAAVAALPEALLAIFTSPITLIIAAVVGLALVFRHQIAKLITDIVHWWQGGASGLVAAWAPVGNFFAALGQGIASVFNALPDVIKNAMIAAYNIVKSAAMAIYQALKYIDPFAKHSPSLVEQTHKGMRHISNAHKQAADATGDAYAGVNQHLQTFKQQTQNLTGVNAQYKTERQNVAKVDPKALASFDRLIADLKRLNPILDAEQKKVDAQQAVVTKWSDAIDKVNVKLQVQQDKLTTLQAQQTKLQNKYDAAASSIQTWANTPIKGTEKFSDALFRNQMAQNRVQLAMDKWSDKNGSLDDLNGRLDKINGSLEVARGTLLRLQSAGAGSEITGVYADQVSQLEKTQKSLSRTMSDSPISKMTDQLTKLQNRADELNLEQSLKLDPLNRKIQQLVDTTKEATFKQITDGIKHEQAAQDRLQPSLDKINRQVAHQQHAVDKLTLAKDKLSVRYDRENGKLTLLNDKYNQTKQTIDSITTALSDVGSAADSAGNKLKKASSGTVPDVVKQFRQNKGNFPSVGGNKGIGRQGGWGDQSSQIKKFTEHIQQQTADLFGGFSMLQPFKDAWHKVQDWFEKNVAPAFAPVKKAWDHIFSGHGGSGPNVGGAVSKVIDPLVNAFRSAKKALQPVITTVSDMISSVFHWILNIVKLVAPDVRRVFHSIADGIRQFWKEAAPQLASFKDLIKPLGHLFQNLWTVVKPVLELLGLALLGVVKIVTSVFGHVIGPIIWTFIKLLTGAIQIIHGVLQVIVGFLNGIIDVIRFLFQLLTGQWGKAWDTLKRIVSEDLGGMVKGVLNIIQGFGKMLYGIISGALGIVVGVIKGFVGAIFGFFKWLYNVLIGHSIIPDLVHGVIKVFKLLIWLPKWIWDHVLKPVVNFFKSMWNDHIKPGLKVSIQWAQDVWKGLLGIGRWIWDHILKPIVDFFKSMWNDFIKPAFKIQIQWAQDIWKGLVGIGKWIWDHILSPVVNFFKNAWDHIKSGIRTFKDDIRTVFYDVGKFIMEGINLGISGIDKLIGGLNWIGKNVPGLHFTIPVIPKLTLPSPPGHASGAVMARREVGAGFKTNGPRAIVGEGHPGHPEYVIPTDPRYRSNALGLLSSLMGDMTRRGTLSSPTASVDGVPGYFGGGILHDITGAASDAWHKALGVGKYIRKEAVTAAFAPFLKAADFFLNKVPNQMHQRDWLMAEKNNFYNYVKGDAATQAHQHSNPNWTPPSKTTGTAGGSGNTAFVWSTLRNLGMSPIIAAGIMGNLLYESSFNPYVIEGGGTSTNPASTSGGYGIAQWTPGSKLIPYLHGAKPSLGGELAAIVAQLHGQGPYPEGGAYSEVKRARTAYDAGTLFGIWYERYKRPPIQYDRSRAAEAYYNRFHGSMSGGGSNSDPRRHMAIGGMIPSLAEGAIIRRKSGGTIVRVAEGGNDEAVVPLPRGFKPPSGGSGDVNIYGNLEFPNITSGDDAEEFIANLKSIAGGQ